MQKEKKSAPDDRLCYLKSGVYLSASAQNPKRVMVKERTPVVVVENRNDNFAVVMIDSQTLILAHWDGIEKVQ